MPNYRHFGKSFVGLIDFALNEQIGKDYEAARGALLHLYLRQLVEDRLNHVIVIPETEYDKARGARDSPDLTLVDSLAGRLVGVEVKGRRINLATRLTIGDDELAENLGDAFDALRKLSGKIADIRSDRSEFDEWREAISTSGESPPVLVVVLREGLQFLSHLLREQVRVDPSHPLAEVTHPWCLITTDDFERAVEIASRTGTPLSTLFEEHYHRSGILDPHQSPADRFGEEGIVPPPDTYASGFMAWPEWQSSLASVGARKGADQDLGAAQWPAAGPDPRRGGE